MNSKSKLAAIVVVAAVGAAAPAFAFAQALQTGTAANRAQLYGSSPSQVVPYGRYAYRANGLGAYAEVPSLSVGDAARRGCHGWRKPRLQPAQRGQELTFC